MSSESASEKTFTPSPKRLRSCCIDPPVLEETSQAVKCINELPDELLLLIFSHLNHVEVIKSVSQVCKRWWNLHEDPSLYRKFVFTAEEPACTDYAINILRRAPWLNTLCLIDRFDTNRILGQMILSQRRIKKLVLKGCSGAPSKDLIKFLVQKQILNRCKQLQHLKVKHSCFSRKFFDEIGSALPQLKNIQFDSTKKSSTEAIRGIIKHCHYLEELRAFAVFDDPQYGRTTNKDVSTLSEKTSTSLTVLKLNGAEWTNIAIKSLTRCKKLKRLHVYHIDKISDFGILNLVNFEHLQFLALVKCKHISSEAWVKLFESESMKLLKSVSLAMCSNVTDKVVQAIGNKLDSLLKIRLTGCSLVTDVGFLDLITGCSELTFLNAYLMDPIINKVFPMLPEYLPNLKTLIYDPVDINSELGVILEQIFVQLPKLTFRAGNKFWKNDIT